MRLALLTVTGLLALAPTASATGMAGRDRVLKSAPRAFAARSASHAYMTADGKSVAVTTSSGYSSATAQQYVDYLGSLPHGDELSRLTVRIATPAEVQAGCGGDPGVLACYYDSTHTMLVPGDPVQSADGITTAYVIAHEYGHHIASFRSNAPFSAPDYGPKYWASYERVCQGVQQARLAVGAETTDAYWSNPGEAWAETYARLTFPAQPWTFTSLLKPDAGALSAARKDVLHPWAKRVTRHFRGTFSRTGSATRHFTFTVRLDGAVDVSVKAPAGAKDRVSFDAGAQQLSSAVACRDRSSEKVKVTVTRRSGSGPFTVTARYPG